MALWERSSFIEQLGGVLNQSIGEIVAFSSIKNASSKLGTKKEYFTPGECEQFIGHVLGSISFFVNERELNKISAELRKMIEKKNAQQAAPGGGRAR